MNESEKSKYSLGQGIRNICDKLKFELNRAILNLREGEGDKMDKIKECKSKLKNDFHQYLKQTTRTLKINQKLLKIKESYKVVSEFDPLLDQLHIGLSFLIIMSDAYIFPEFNINHAIDRIFDNCNDGLKSKLIDIISSDIKLYKNLINNKDSITLLNNDFDSIDLNNDKKEEINEKNNEKINTKIKNILQQKIEDFNQYIIINNEDLNENNFKLYFDKYICIKFFNNLDIKFILVQCPLKKDSYNIMPIEIQYNNKIINLNDQDEKFQDKNKLFSKNDLYFFIDKFKPKYGEPNSENIIIEKLNNSDFVQKCLLFKDYIIEFFNNKFEDIKKDIKKSISKYDFPLRFEDNNNKMEYEDNDNIIMDENYNNQLTIFYNFPITMKDKNEFYIKLIFDKNNPTKIKLIYSHYILKNKNEQRNELNLIIKEKESILNFDLKKIKNEIYNLYEDYKTILLKWIGKKLKYIYPLYFDAWFSMDNFDKIIFEIKNNEKPSTGIFSLCINDKGKLIYDNLYSSKIIIDDFKEINSILINYLKCDDEEKCFQYIIQFNDYIKSLIIEKIFTFSGCKIKLIDLNYTSNQMNLLIYNSINTDKNISTYFDIKAQIFKANKKNEKKKNCIINKFIINDINLICSNNKEPNKKIIFNCINPIYKIETEFNSKYEEYFRELINELNNKYELYMIHIYDLLNLLENPNSNLEMKNPLYIINNNIYSGKEDAQWFDLVNEPNNFDIFKRSFKDKLMKYFKKISISINNNIFRFYLKDKVYKSNEKYKKLSNYYFENYATMIQNYILGYDWREDAISFTFLGKIKLGYFNKVQALFDEILPNIINYMDKIFKLVDYLLNNEPVPEMRLCPIYFTLQLKYQDSFKQHINIRFQNDKIFYIIDGNYNPIFINFFLKGFGEELMSKTNDNNDRDDFSKQIKFFYINYKIFDFFINECGFKFSIIDYSYNHFKPQPSKIYFFYKEYNILELISLNNMLLTIQIKYDHSLYSLYLSFRDKINVDKENNMHSSFIEELGNSKLDVKINIEKKTGYNNVIILIDDCPNLLDKFRSIINIFISLSNK